MRLVHPDVVLHPGIPTPDQDAPYRGHRGMETFFRLATDVWETVTAEPEAMLEASGDRILVLDRWHFRGRAGIEIDDELANAYTFRDGLIVKIDGYTDRAEARAAVGLE